VKKAEIKESGPAKEPLPPAVRPEKVVETKETELNLGVSDEKVDIPDDTVKKIVEEKIEAKEPEKERFDYVSPPDYLKFGRGLVYNCKVGHWACVDKASFFQCRNNQKHFKEIGKPTECYTKSVYSSDLDCRTIQLHFINTNEKTDFCK